MITKKINYVYSLLLHSILILLCIYFIELDKPKKIYNKVININLYSFAQKKNNINEKEYFYKAPEKEKVEPIKKVLKNIEPTSGTFEEKTKKNYQIL